MSTEYLGTCWIFIPAAMTFVFPHHENEISPVEGATGHPFVRYWMHNGLNIDNEKMSKSRRACFTVRDILKQYEPEDVRMFTLSAQPRSRSTSAETAWGELTPAWSGCIRLVNLARPRAESRRRAECAGAGCAASARSAWFARSSRNGGRSHPGTKPIR